MFERFKKGLERIIEFLSTSELDEATIEKYRDDIVFTLVENDVAFIVAENIVEDLKRKVEGLRVERFSEKRRLIRRLLREVLLELFLYAGKLDLIAKAEEKRRKGEPLVVLFVGPNGHGKTTTIAKIAYLLKKRGYSVVIAASDTFRAGAIEQLMEHAKKVGVKVIKQEYGADPAAVAFDAIMHAKSRGIDVVLIDTAGRMQTDVDLMNEMKKIYRVANPDLVIFVGDALTGNDAFDEALKFNEAVPLDGSVLTKMDADAKGGAAISIVYATRKPLIFIGVGQGYEDLK
ncbi:MAG: signal recognition particle-docking protein FtsY, partial [Thermoprotei archaeon]